MYKLILVDDEEEVRKGMLRKVDWAGHGFEIAGEAENGHEALAIAEKTPPDVVVTDIKMPFMDGIELSETLSKKYPTVKIIILTGFDEFEYARKAINLNVVEYILKPIASKEFTELLDKVKKRLDEEIAEKENVEALRKHYEKSLPILREKFLSSLITSRVTDDEFLEKNSSYAAGINGDVFIVSVVSNDAICGEGSKSEGLSEALFHPLKDKKLLKFAMLNITGEVVAKFRLGLAFLHDDTVVVILSFRNEERDEAIGRVLAVFEEVRQCIEKYLRFTVTIGVGTFCSSPADFSRSYQNAVNALEYRLILGSNRIICIQDVEPKCREKVEFDELKERLVMSAVRVGNAAEMEETIHALFREIIELKVSFKDYQIYLLEMLTAILKVARDLCVDMDCLFGHNHNLFMEMYGFTNIHEVRTWITGICMKIMNSISKDRQDTCKLIVKKAKKYIQEHYHKSDTSIDKICKTLYISPTYFSTVFKKETKLTFVSYLTQIRMEAAKELLRTTGLRASEIAGRVGYSDPNYFSICFKKFHSISPTAYRNHL